MDEEIKKEIRKMTLQNAFEHEGETRDKIILGKIPSQQEIIFSQLKVLVQIIMVDFLTGFIQKEEKEKLSNTL